MITFPDYLLQIVIAFCIGYFLLKKRDAALLSWMLFVPFIGLGLVYLFKLL